MVQGVGELFVLGFRGSQVPAWLRDFAGRFGLGGVILFDYDVKTRTFDNNIHSREQLTALCRQLHALPSVPLIYLDQEGGKVRRLKEKLGFAPLPSQWEMARFPVEEKKSVWDRAYAELKILGIDVNLAPVVDLNYNPQNPDIGAIERSYSDQPAVVEANTLLLDPIARRHRVGLCLKHYPGLGGARVNSHLELTDLTGTFGPEQETLFIELGKRIFGNSVLVSHGIVADWEADCPVSMSEVALSRLRRELPDTVLISDDLQMQGLQKRFSTEEACRRGIAAGLDLVIVGNNLMDQQGEAVGWAEAVVRLAEHDASFGQTVTRALARVRRLKADLRPESQTD